MIDIKLECNKQVGNNCWMRCVNKKKFSMLKGSQRVCIDEDCFEYRANCTSSVGIEEAANLVNNI